MTAGLVVCRSLIACFVTFSCVHALANGARPTKAEKHAIAAAEAQCQMESPLRATTDAETWEGFVFAADARVGDDLGPLAKMQFFVVENPVFVERDGALSIQTVWAHGSPKILVAVDGREVVGVLACGRDSAEDAFNQIVRHMNMRVKTPSQAVRMFRLFRRLAALNGPNERVLDSDLHLLSVAIEDYLWRGGRDASAEFEKWRLSVYLEVKAVIERPKARATEAGSFAVDYWEYREGIVSQGVAAIHVDGTVHTQGPESRVGPVRENQ